MNSVLILEMKTRSTDPSSCRVRCVCCSWCCESGRCHTSAITRLFHNTRVAPYCCRQRGAQPQMTHIDHLICCTVYAHMYSKGHLKWWARLFKQNLLSAWNLFTLNKMLGCFIPWIRQIWNSFHWFKPTIGFVYILSIDGLKEEHFFF